MKTLSKLIAGLSVAGIAALALSAPALATGNNDWDAVGYSQHLDGGDSMRFDIPFDGGCYAIISVVGAEYDDDLDLRIVYPDGYTVYAVIEDQASPSVALYGEASYGSYTVGEALEALLKEIQEVTA